MRLRSIAWACAAGLAVSALLHSSALVLATLAASVLAAAVTISRRRAFVGVTVTRVPSRRVVSWGGDLEVCVTVSNAKLLPLLWLRIRDRWPRGLEPHGFALEGLDPSRSLSFAQTVSLRWYERLRRRYHVRCDQRGLHRFGPMELDAGDPLGIAGATRGVEAYEEFVVLPKVLDVPDLTLLMGQPLVDEPTPRSLARDPLALRGVRAYVPGDPLRAVNWRATARSARLCTNEYDPTSLAAVRLLLDLAVLEHAREGIATGRMELLCVVAASLASAFAAAGYGVGLASNARLVRDWRAVDIEPGEGALEEVLETLGRVLLFPPGGFGPILAAEADDETATADCVVVTSALRADVLEPLARLRAVRPTRVVYVGRPEADQSRMVDAVVPADFDWRANDALPRLG